MCATAPLALTVASALQESEEEKFAASIAVCKLPCRGPPAELTSPTQHRSSRIPGKDVPNSGATRPRIVGVIFRSFSQVPRGRKFGLSFFSFQVFWPHWQHP